MEKKENKLWLIVWYDNDYDEEERDEKGNLIEDDSKYVPYRLSCAYLDLTYSDWKYVKFPNRAGEVGTWKRSEWMGECFPLDFVFKNLTPRLKHLEGTKVEDLIDITSYLAEGDVKSLRADVARHTEDLNKILKWKENN